MSSQGKKRAGTSYSQSKPSQARQGSSFSPCPACRTAVHAALMAFHLSSCPVIAEEGPAKKRKENHRRPPQATEEESRVCPSSGSPKRSIVSVSETKQEYPPEFAEDMDRFQRGGTEWPLAMGASVSQEKLFYEPETPMQESGRDRVGGGIAREAPEGRKRLFEDWGEELSPESESVIPPMVAFGVDSQFKRARVIEGNREVVTLDAEDPTAIVDLALLDSDSEDEIEELDTQPYVGSVRDSQQQLGEAAVSSDLSDKIGQLGWSVESGGDGAPKQLSQVEDGNVKAGDSVSQMEIELESALRELRERYSELEYALQAKSDECEQLRRRELEAQNELLSVRRLYETPLQVTRVPVSSGEPQRSQSHTQEDEELATQILLETSNPPASPWGAQDQLVATRASSENTMLTLKPADTDEEEQATQLLSQGFNPGSSPCLLDSGQNSQRATASRQGVPVDSQFRWVSHSGAELPDEPLGDSIPSLAWTQAKVDKRPVRRLFDGVTGTMGGTVQSDGDEPSVMPRHSSERVGGLWLGPQTPGKALQPGNENEKSEGREDFECKGWSNASLCTVQPHQNKGTPGGLVTPQKFEITLGERKSGLINDLLGGFPPAQGTEPQSGVDPFDVNGSTWNLPHISMDHPNLPRHVQSPVRHEGVERNVSYNEGQAARTVSSEHSDGDSLLQMRLKKKRRKPTVVVDSDSDADIGDEEVRPTLTTDLEDLRKGNEFGLKIDRSNSGMEGQISNPAAEKNHSSPDSVMKAFSRNTGGDMRLSSIPSGNRARSGLNPSPIIEDLSSDSSLAEKVSSPPLVNVVLSIEEKEDICGGSPGNSSKRRLKRLVRAKESTNGAKGLQLGPQVEGRIKDEGTPPALRRSQRLRNLSRSKRNVCSSEDLEESESDAGRSNSSAATTNATGQKPHILEDDVETAAEMGSDSSEVEVLQKRRKTSELRRHPSGNKLEIKSNDDDDDSSFINDDSESDADSGDQLQSASSGSESSKSGGESDSVGSASSSSTSLGEPKKKFNWELEGDMLASLSKDRDLCMRGLCALFRRQELDEQQESNSKYRNKRGFDKFNATKASIIASFLLGGSGSNGPVVKTSAQLEERFGEDVLPYCEDMCKRHSKQLFESFQTDEDPYFP